MLKTDPVSKEITFEILIEGLILHKSYRHCIILLCHRYMKKFRRYINLPFDLLIIWLSVKVITIIDRSRHHSSWITNKSNEDNVMYKTKYISVADQWSLMIIDNRICNYQWISIIPAYHWSEGSLVRRLIGQAKILLKMKKKMNAFEQNSYFKSRTQKRGK